MRSRPPAPPYVSFGIGGSIPQAQGLVPVKDTIPLFSTHYRNVYPDGKNIPSGLFYGMSLFFGKEDHRLLIPCRIFAEHVGDPCHKGGRHTATLQGTTFHTSQAVDAQIPVTSSRFLRRNCTGRTATDTGSAFYAVFIC